MQRWQVQEVKVVDRDQEDDPYDLEPMASLSTIIEKAEAVCSFD